MPGYGSNQPPNPPSGPAYPRPPYAHDPKGYYDEHPGGGPIYNGRSESNSLALASLILSIVGLVFLCVYGGGGLFSAAALVTGYMARKQNLKPSDQDKVKTSIILGWMGVVLSVLIIITIIVLLAVGLSLDAGTMMRVDD